MDRRSSNRENNVNASSWRPTNGIFDTYNDNHRNDYGDSAPSVTNQLLPVSSSSPSASSSSLSGYIEHPVSQFDTLAGVAIRYGVEVADIKRLNGLATDIQMFALKSLHIPLPGRHPPSTCLSNGFDDTGECSSERTPPQHTYANLFESFQSLRPKKSSPLKISPAMSSLQGYYGLKSKDQRTDCGNLEMAALEKGGSRYLEDIRPAPGTNPPLSKHRKSKSLIIDFLAEEGDAVDQTPSAEESTDRWFEKIARRRQKSESNFTGMSMTPEMVLREDKGAGNGGFSASAGKCLALRSKATTRTSLSANANDTYPTGSGDLVGPNGSLSSVNVRKSSSTSSLQDQEMNGMLSIWPTSKWSLKPDLQSHSTAAITKPIFDGLPRPVTSRRNKAALD